MSERANETVELTEAGERYLDLLKQCLNRYIFIDEEVRDVRSLGWRRPLVTALASRGLRLVRTGGDRESRKIGRDWPAHPHAETMVGLRRLDNLQHCITHALRDGVAGDLIETGVWRGGATIFMKAVLVALGDSTRRVWAADSFQGLPKPNSEQYPADIGLDLTVYSELAVSVDQVKANFARYGLLDDRVEFLVGWFKDTLAVAPIERLAVMRLDGDLYESTMDALTALYPRLSVGGYVIIDDYNNAFFNACRQAVTDFRAAQHITEPLEEVDWTAVFWRRMS